MALKLRLGDYIHLKKRHPCGEFRWKVTRLGDHVGLECFGCGRLTMFYRAQLESKVKEIRSARATGDIRN
ncbi:DUF951 domain-containing protein [SAR202 cluster bacterium AD-804-J14_MRT_500m]|nr:DUF951 domain-containing protein [SAR202 cluster bacterium AD-804-J14_MRT_500m]